MGTFVTKELAVEAAERHLERLTHGGELRVRSGDGAVVETRRIGHVQKSDAWISQIV
jgi:hypothetical protein